MITELELATIQLAMKDCDTKEDFKKNLLEMKKTIEEMLELHFGE